MQLKTKTYNKSNKIFIYKDIELNYCINSHNTRGDLTERVVEIPILEYTLSVMDSPVEIGCVSPYYWDVNHEVYDLTDPHPYCKNIDAKNIEINNKNIISISTVEHFDADHRTSDQAYISSIDYIHNIIKYSNKYLISFPLGYNDTLTEYVLNTDNIKIDYIARDIDNSWSQIKKEQLTTQQISYNKQVWYANSIGIIQNIL